MSSAVDKLKQYIREEIKKAVKAEVTRVLNESRNQPMNYQSTLKKSVINKSVPITLNTEETQRAAIPKFDSRANPFAAMLNETAMSFDSSDVHSFSSLGKVNNTQTKTGTVSDMLSTARPSSNMDMVEIDTVPDFSGLMNKMKERGDI